MLEKTGVIFIDEIKQSFRDKKVVALLASYTALLAFGISEGSFFRLIATLFYFNTGLDASLIITFYVSSALVPLISLMISHDSVSGETYSNSIRYVASRIDRMSFLAGKYLSAFTIITAVNLAAYILLGINDYYQTSEWMMKDYLLTFAFITAYSLCFLSIGFFSSVSAKKPSSSLWVSITITSVMAILFVRDIFSELVPFNYLGSFVKGDYLGFFVFLAYAAAFFLLSAVIFRRADL